MVQPQQQVLLPRVRVLVRADGVLDVVDGAEVERPLDLDDALSRRTRSILLDAAAAIEVAPKAASIMAAILVRETFGYSFSTWRFHLRGETIRSAHDVGWMRSLTVGSMMRKDVRTIDASTTIDRTDFRAISPRFATEARTANAALVDLLRQVAERKAATPAQIALAWLLSDPVITSPVIGPRSMEQLADNLGAAGLRLSQEEKQELDEASQP